MSTTCDCCIDKYTGKEIQNNKINRKRKIFFPCLIYDGSWL